MTAGCCGCWPSGAGTTVPGCARGTGAGAMGLCAACEVGHGGSGVLEQAVSKTAANTAEAFHGIHRSGFCPAAGGKESEDPRFAKICMVMVLCCWGATQGGFCYEDVTCAYPICCVSIHPVANGILTGETRPPSREREGFAIGPLRPRHRCWARLVIAFLRAAGPAQSRGLIECGPFLRAGDR